MNPRPTPTMRQSRNTRGSRLLWRGPLRVPEGIKLCSVLTNRGLTGRVSNGIDSKNPHQGRGRAGVREKQANPFAEGRTTEREG